MCLHDNEIGWSFVLGITVDFIKRFKHHMKTSRFERGIWNYEILQDDISYEEAETLEEYYITLFDTYKNGLNMTPTGKGKNENVKFNTLGMTYSEKSKRKMSAKAKGRKAWNKGIPHSEATKKNWSIKRKGKFWGSLKFTEAIVTEILLLYQSNPEIKFENCKSKNGKMKTYLNEFSKLYSAQYNCTSAWMRKLISGEMVTWNPLVNKILNTQY